jgi:D-glycero-alpha-D-manno-heptose 1-phosphate guanylyltransferase
MSSNKTLHNVDALILCGGQGTRFRSVMQDRPKSLAQFKEKTFLDILTESLLSQGFTKIILCVGHLKDHIKDKYRNFPNIFISEENIPLGTGGAVKNAQELITSEDFFVTNGDSIFNGLDFGEFYEFHKKQGSLISVALAAPRKEKDFGGVILSKSNQITAFTEKNNLEDDKLMNGGVYFARRDALRLMPEGPFSLENDFFPKLTGDSLYGFFSSGEVFDIGTPERYERAKTILS